MSTGFSIRLPLGSLLSAALFASHALHADDVEIYVAPPGKVISPNVLFLLDYSSSMYMTKATGGGRPIDNLQQALDTILKDPANGDVNAAFLNYYALSLNGDERADVLHGFGRMATHYSTMLAAVSNASPQGYTPLGYGIAAAMRWFEESYKGEPSPLQNAQPAGNWCKPNMIILMADGETGGAYRQDLKEPNKNNELGGTWSIPALPSQQLLGSNGLPLASRYRGQDCVIHNLTPQNLASNPVQNAWSTQQVIDGICIEEMIRWGQDVDLKSGGEWDWDSNDPIRSPATRRRQNIEVHTVYFGSKTDPVARGYVKFLADIGGGSMYEGHDAAQLTHAFNAILQDARASIQYTYTAPSVPYDQKNVAVSGDYIYIPLFKPGTHSLWYGNLKKFKLRFENVNGVQTMVLRDRFDKPVLDSKNLFTSSADLWNTGANDQGDPLLGGAASHMKAGSGQERKLYTWLGASKNLTDPSNRVSAANSLLDSSYLGNLNSSLFDPLGATFQEKRKKILDWMTWEADLTLPDGNGGNVTVSHQGEMGAPLHTHPVHLTFGSRNLVFITTTEGVLHALDASTGEEMWAFMPADLLHTIPGNFLSDWNYSKPHSPNGEAIPPMDHGHVLKPGYGLDGPLVSYEHNNRTYLIMGMRRGGRNYYTLDITDPENPRFAWMIEGGAPGDFAGLGQTWSKPLYAKVDFEGQGNPEEVLIIAGGYDPAKDHSYIDANSNGVFDTGDTALPRTDDAMGNFIYFVDPATGHLHPKYGVITDADMVRGEMKNGIAADLFPVDINSNGITDRLYAVDVGGRVIRVDIPDQGVRQATNNGKVSATVLADVNIDAFGNVQVGTDYQRFFATPEVAYYYRGGVQYLALMVPSGNRAEPLSEVVSSNRFYMIKDPNVWGPPPLDQNGVPDYPDPITEDPASPRHLYDATANLIQAGNAQQKAQAQTALSQASGWFVNLGAGEKGFTSPIVYDYAVLFTTYKGTRPNGNDPCDVPVPKSESFFYALEMTNGGAKFAAMDGQQGLDTSDRSRKVDLPGLPPAPYLLFPKTKNGNSVKLGGEVLALVGLEEVLRWADRFHPISWEEVVDD